MFVNNFFDLHKSPALMTDLYQLTMIYGYWKSGKADQFSSFNLFFRKNPFCGNYAVSSGQEFVKDYINSFKFEKDDIEYIKSLYLFEEEEFFEYLSNLRLTLNIDAVYEGTIVFPNEPMLRVSGPILQCQLVETAILHIMNFATLIATKASRVCHAANGHPVLEFGLRRAQGIDGCLSASRSAYIGGCTATSNVLAGKLFGIPVKGTHAHSWVMSFDTELEAFTAYAKAMPNNCIFLVDTYDTMQGIKNAITVGKTVLRPNGFDLKGIRIDSGDLGRDSVVAKALLRANDFENTSIIVSDDLDEYKITDIVNSENEIDAFGVGTNLVTAKDDPALGGVYKLSAIELSEGIIENKIKYTGCKTTLPGILQISRTYDDEANALKDIIHFPGAEHDGVHLLRSMFKEGVICDAKEGLFITRARADYQLKKFSNLLGINNKNSYPVEVDNPVIEEQNRLIQKIRGELK